MDPTGKKRFKSLLIPLLIYIGISYVVNFIVAMLVMGKMAGDIVGNKISYDDALSKGIIEMTKYSVEISIITALVSLPVMGYLYYRDQKQKDLNGIARRKKEKLWKYSGIIVLAITAGIAINSLFTLSNLASVSSVYQQTEKNLYASSFIVQLVGIVLIIPIFEEVLFRGVLYNRLLEASTPKRAMLISAILFGVFHGNIVQTLYGGIMGYLLAYIYEKYGSLKAPILGHAILNLCSILLTRYGIFEWLIEKPLRVGIVTVACAAIGSTMFVLIRDMNDNLIIDEKKESPAD